MFDAITIGAATRDVFLKSKAFKPKRDKSSSGADIVLPLGSKISVDEIIFDTGGGATNAAVTFARQGLKTGCICKVGEDPGGRATIDFLTREGIETDLVIKDRVNYTGYSIIIVANNGGRTILVYRGASGHFTDEMVPKTRLDTNWLFISSLGGNIKMLTSLINWASSHSIKVALVPGSLELKKGSKVLYPIFTKADIVIMNKEEAAGLTGVSVDKKEKVVHKMCLLTRGVGVVTDAKNGATACDREYFYHIGTHENKAIERTGAGDAFASGFVAGLIKYENVEGALELAADNASSVVNYFGAKRGIIHLKEKPFKKTLKITKTSVR